MIRAGIDIGTNTFLLLVARVEINQIVDVLRDEARVVRLGQGVDATGKFQEEALARARTCLNEYHGILQEFSGVQCRLVATSASRDVSNAPEFFDEIKSTYGFDVQIVSGAEEAQLSYQGTLSGVTNPEDYLVLDIGGGSTEFVTKIDGTELIRNSFDLGCVRLTERFVHSDPATKEELAELRNFVRSQFSQKQDFFGKFKGKRCMSVAGTATYLAGVAQDLSKFLPEKVDRYNLQLETLGVVLERMIPMLAKERIGLGGMDAGRADVILSGAIILEESLRALDKDETEVSIRGLRYGIVLEGN